MTRASYVDLGTLDIPGGAPGTDVLEREAPDLSHVVDVPWTTTVWNDPVNLMNYVTRVFREYFGHPQAEAERLMLLVHHEGRAVVASGAREEMERHTQAMHDYGLWATVERGRA